MQNHEEYLARAVVFNGESVRLPLLDLNAKQLGERETALRVVAALSDSRITLT